VGKEKRAVEEKDVVSETRRVGVAGSYMTGGKRGQKMGQRGREKGAVSLLVKIHTETKRRKDGLMVS